MASKLGIMTSEAFSAEEWEGDLAFTQQTFLKITVVQAQV